MGFCAACAYKTSNYFHTCINFMTNLNNNVSLWCSATEQVIFSDNCMFFTTKVEIPKWLECWNIFHIIYNMSTSLIAQTERTFLQRSYLKKSWSLSGFYMSTEFFHLHISLLLNDWKFRGSKLMVDKIKLSCTNLLCPHLA